MFFMNYIDLANKYEEIITRIIEKPFYGFRPRLHRLKQAAEKGAQRCRELFEQQEYVDLDVVEDLLRRCYLGDFNSSMYELSLHDCVQIRKGIEALSCKFEKRSLTKEEYRDLRHIARKWGNTCNTKVLKELRKFNKV